MRGKDFRTIVETREGVKRVGDGYFKIPTGVPGRYHEIWFTAWGRIKFLAYGEFARARAVSPEALMRELKWISEEQPMSKCISCGNPTGRRARCRPCRREMGITVQQEAVSE